MQEFMKSQSEAIMAFRRSYASSRGQFEFSGAYRSMDVAKVDYFDKIKKYLQTDLEQILLAKKIRVLGQFKTRDEMTFDDKKRAVYAFTPEISITVDTKYTSNPGPPYTEEGDLIVNGFITLTLRESITGEKLWIKRIEAEPVTMPYRFVAKYKEPLRLEETLTVVGMPLDTGSFKEDDTTDQALAEALDKFYASLGKKLWAHIDPEEWSKYLEQAKKLRKEKRY
jgi:hypothetical protein